MELSSNPPGESEIGKPNEGSPLEKVLSSGIQLRTSARVSKKLKQDLELHASAASLPVPSNDKKGVGASGGGAEELEKKAPGPRRKAPPWSVEEKAAFFEALNEHGKNFESIETSMSLRATKRRSDRPLTNKNRGQARNFYYRTWLKLSKYVKFPESVGKVAQELYALINFGELRKKVGKVTEKNAAKLYELIYCGSTQVRVRGKAWRVKTPVCPALRKLNKLQENADEVKLPSRVEVLVNSRSVEGWARVQGLGHNPRVRTTLPLDAPLRPLIDHLQAKWSPKPPTSPPFEGEAFRLGPGSGLTITRPAFRCGQIVSSTALSLLAHQKRTNGLTEDLLSQIQLGKAKWVAKWQREEAAGEEFLNTGIVDPAASVPQAEEEEEKKEEFEARIRQGWTSETAASTRIGQLYIMFGRDGTLNLEYWWEGKEEPPISIALQRLLSLAKLYHQKAKVECPCGHVCKGGVGGGGGGAGGKRKGGAAPTPTANPNPPPTIASNQLGSTNQAGDDSGNSDIGRFKTPLLPLAPRTSPQASRALKALQQFRPKYTNRRGRSRAKSGVVVQRVLLPKASSDLLNPAPVTLVTLSVLPTSQLPSLSAAAHPNPAASNPLLVPTSVALAQGDHQQLQGGVVSGEAEDRDPLEIPISVKMPTSPTATFSGVLGVSGTPPTSPTSILREGDGSHWLNSEVGDYSLSSFLGHLESPLKPSTAPASEDTRLSADVESHFQSLMSESSLDYTAKFADLAAKIASSPTPSTSPTKQLS